MAKVLNNKELEEKANEVFDQFPNAKKVFATADGEIFLQENRANLHAGAKGSVYPFDRPAEKEAKEAKPSDKADFVSAEDQIKAIAESKTLEDLEQFKSDSRKTVVKALEARTAELTPAQ